MDGERVPVHHMHMAKQVRPQPKRRYRATFIRQWREFRLLTLEQLAERVDMTHASLSRIERGLQPYSQATLEAIADALQTDAASLLMRDPTAEDAIWSIWDQARPAEREQIVAVARALVKRTGT